MTAPLRLNPFTGPVNGAPVLDANTIRGNANAIVTAFNALVDTVQTFPVLDAELPFDVVDTRYPYGWLRRFGVVPGSLVAQDLEITNCINAVNAMGGGLVYADGGLGDVWVTVTGWYTVANWRGILFKDVSNIFFWQDPGCVFKQLDCTTSNHSTLFGVMDASNIHFWRPKGLGDAPFHSGPVGEDGHGLGLVPSLVGNTDIFVYYPDFKYCYGDGIFVGIDDSKNYALAQWNRNVVIVEPTLQYNRRQGLSGVCGVGVQLIGGDYSYNGGTSPGAGIDLEPQIDLYGNYAPVTGWKLVAPRANYNWRGIVVTNGAQAEVIEPTTNNNSLIDLQIDMGRGTKVVVDGYNVLHDEAVAPSPLPTAVSILNGSGAILRNGVLKGRFLKGVFASGSGSGFGKHTIDGLDIEADGDCEIAVQVANTCNETSVTRATVRGAQRSLVAGSNKLTLDLTSYDAVGASNPNLSDIEVSGDDCTVDVSSTRAAGTGITVSSANRMSGTVRSRLAGTYGVFFYDVQDSPNLVVDSAGSGQSASSGFNDLVVTGNSSDNTIPAYLRPIAGKPLVGLAVLAGCERNDFRGSDMRGYSTADYVFDDPSTIYEREPATETKGDANVTVTAYSAPTQRMTATRTADRTWRISPLSMFTGFRSKMLFEGLGAYTVTVGVPKGGGEVVENDGSLRYVPFSGQIGQYASTTPTVPIPNGTGAIVITALITSNAWTTSATQQYLTSQDAGAGTTERGWGLLKASNGILSFTWSTNGTSITNTLANATPVPGAVDGVPIWVRVTIANSGGNVAGTFATAAYVPGSIAIPGVFTPYGAVPTVSGSIASMHLSTYPLEVGGIVSGGVQVWDGDVYRMQLTVGGSTSVDMNPETDATDGVSSWTRAAAETWTLHGDSGATVPVATLPASTAGKIEVESDDTGAVFLSGYEEWP